MGTMALASLSNTANIVGLPNQGKQDTELSESILSRKKSMSKDTAGDSPDGNDAEAQEGRIW